ncbi:MAG: hypothetical protein ACYTJ0_10925 [Planctomycetota bacterium]|jgi:hypothetical protein
MRSCFQTLVVAIATGGAFAASAQDTSRDVLRRHFDRNLERVSEESRRALPGLLLYPPEVREAILVVCQYPELVVRLFDVDTDDAAAVAALADPYPDGVAAAAEVLVTHRDVLAVLEENLVATAVVGRVYAEDPAFIARTVNRLAEEARDEHEASVDAWSGLLEGDPDVLDQLEAASRAFAEEEGVEEPSGERPAEPAEPGYDSWEDDWWYLTYGYWWVPGGIWIGDLPCGRFIEWLLENCDKFPELGDRIIHHVRDRIENGRGEQFPGEMGDAFARWKQGNPVTTMQGFLNDDGQRVERLRELGMARRELADGGAATARVMQHVRQNPERFPALARPAGPDRGAAGRDPGAGTRPVAGQRPATGAGRPARPARQVQRTSPSQRQQLMRAVTRHRTAWRGAQPARMPARPAGGMRRGGFRGR